MSRPEFVVAPTSTEQRKITDERSRSLSIAARREIASWSESSGLSAEFSESSYEATTGAKESNTFSPSQDPAVWGGG